MKKIILVVLLVSVCATMVAQRGISSYHPSRDYGRPVVGSFVPVIGGGYAHYTWLEGNNWRRGRIFSLPAYARVSLQDGRTVWVGDENGQTRYYANDPLRSAQAQLVLSRADRQYAKNERYRVRTQNLEDRNTDQVLKSRLHKKANDELLRQQERGTPSAVAARHAGYQESDKKFSPTVLDGKPAEKQQGAEKKEEDSNVFTVSQQSYRLLETWRATNTAVVNALIQGDTATAKDLGGVAGVHNLYRSYLNSIVVEKSSINYLVQEWTKLYEKTGAERDRLKKVEMLKERIRLQTQPAAPEPVPAPAPATQPNPAAAPVHPNSAADSVDKEDSRKLVPINRVGVGGKKFKY